MLIPLPTFHGVATSSGSVLLAFGFAGLTALGMLCGVWAMYRFEKFAVRHTAELIAFAAGLLVAGALLHLLVRAVELAGSGPAMVWALGSFLGLYLVEAHFVPHVHARGDRTTDAPEVRRGDFAIAVILGLAIHSLVDGVSVGAALSASPLIGWVTLLLVFVHKMPVGIASMSALYHAGTPGRRALWLASGLALVTPIAVLASYFLIREIPDRGLGILLGLAAGSFLYVGAADLLPEGQARGRVANTVFFIAGALIMVALRAVGG